MKQLLLLFLLLFGSAYIRVSGQSNNPYFLNGNATQDNCNCYTLTQDQMTQSGSVWNINKINLNQSFTFSFNVYLGCRDADGADGIVFMLQPISTSIGSSGGGLGFRGITPSVGITLDTWQNITSGENDNDPTYDHIAIQVNGNLDHNSSSNRAGPATILESSNNAEDCQWHVLKVEWNAATKELKASVDGKERVKATIDMVGTIFNNDPMVFWGFSASTGGSSNLQKFCTSLNPGFYMPDDPITCFPTPIAFADSSESFGSIVEWYWDFGDGTKFTGQNPPPHVYPAPGNYTAKLNILGNNGCVSDTFSMKVLVGSEPTARFTRSDNLNCEGLPLQFTDASAVTFGNINAYEWKVDNVVIDTLTQPGWQYAFNAGTHNVALKVFTREGCVSAPYTLSIPVAPRPSMQMQLQDGCANTPIELTASSTSVNPMVRQYYWNLNGKVDSTARVQFTANATGVYPISSFAIGTNGCPSDTLEGTVQVYQTNAFAGNDTTAAAGNPIQLRGSGGLQYRWSPSTGLNNANIPNPIATLQNDQTYVLTAYTPAGCESTDTLNIKVYKGPAIYVPTAFTPNGDGLNDKLRFVAVGIQEVKAFRIYNRYGQLVYTNPDQFAGWDGRVGGKQQDTGTYVWYIDATDNSGKPLKQKGVITLIR